MFRHSLMFSRVAISSRAGLRPASELLVSRIEPDRPDSITLSSSIAGRRPARQQVADQLGNQLPARQLVRQLDSVGLMEFGLYSRIRRLADCQLVDRTTRGLVILRNGQLADQTTRVLDKSRIGNSRMQPATLRGQFSFLLAIYWCFLADVLKHILRQRFGQLYYMSTQPKCATKTNTTVSGTRETASWCIREFSSYQLNALITRFRESYSSMSMSHESKRLKKFW